MHYVPALGSSLWWCAEHGPVKEQCGRGMMGNCWDITMIQYDMMWCSWGAYECT